MDALTHDGGQVEVVEVVEVEKGVDMDGSHKRSDRKARAGSQNAIGYIIAIVGVIGGAIIMPPFPLLILGIIALVGITLVIIIGVCVFQWLSSKRRSPRQISQSYIQEPLPEPVYSHAPSPTNHA